MLVSYLLIEGRVSRDMYDEHPGFAFFHTDGCHEIVFPRLVSIATAKAVAESAWRQAEAEAEAESAEDEYDGQFSPVGIVLMGQDHAVLQNFTAGHWVTKFAPPETWPTLLAQARAAESDAAFEAGWDNFSTAEGLRAQAVALRRKVAIAQANLDAEAIVERSVEVLRGLDERGALGQARMNYST